MNVSLTPELEKMVQACVASGMYNNASEVIREALRLMIRQEKREQDYLEWLRAEIKIGWDQAERGELVKPDMRRTINKALAKKRQSS